MLQHDVLLCVVPYSLVLVITHSLSTVSEEEYNTVMSMHSTPIKLGFAFLHLLCISEWWVWQPLNYEVMKYEIMLF